MFQLLQFLDCVAICTRFMIQDLSEKVWLGMTQIPPHGNGYRITPPRTSTLWHFKLVETRNLQAAENTIFAVWSPLDTTSRVHLSNPTDPLSHQGLFKAQVGENLFSSEPERLIALVVYSCSYWCTRCCCFSSWGVWKMQFWNRLELFLASWAETAGMSVLFKGNYLPPHLPLLNRRAHGITASFLPSMGANQSERAVLAARTTANTSRD